MRKLLAAFAALALVATPVAAAPGDNHYVAVHNHSGVGAAIVSIQLQNAEGRVFTANNSYIRAGYYRNLNFDDGTGRCYYNIAAKFDNGTIARRNAVNVCETVHWRLYDIDNTLE